MLGALAARGVVEVEVTGGPAVAMRNGYAATAVRPCMLGDRLWRPSNPLLQLLLLHAPAPCHHSPKFSAYAS